jgi:hypothetical protein
MPNQVRKESPTSQDSGTRVSVAAEDATLYKEGERWWCSYSEIYPPACADLGTLRRLSDWRSIRHL